MEVFRFYICIIMDQGYMYRCKIYGAVGIISFHTNIGTTSCEDTYYCKNLWCHHHILERFKNMNQCSGDPSGVEF